MKKRKTTQKKYQQGFPLFLISCTYFSYLSFPRLLGSLNLRLLRSRGEPVCFGFSSGAKLWRLSLKTVPPLGTVVAPETPCMRRSNMVSKWIKTVENLHRNRSTASAKLSQLQHRPYCYYCHLVGYLFFIKAIKEGVVGCKRISSHTVRRLICHHALACIPLPRPLSVLRDLAEATLSHLNQRLHILWFINRSSPTESWFQHSLPWRIWTLPARCLLQEGRKKKKSPLRIINGCGRLAVSTVASFFKGHSIRIHQAQAQNSFFFFPVAAGGIAP